MCRGGKQTPLKNMYVFDLESCDDEFYLHEEIPKQRVWLSGYMNIETQEFETFTDLESCLMRLFNKGGNQNVEVGVHNLSFDGSFIIPQLIKMGYTPVESKPKEKEFTVLIDERNAWYTISIQVTKKRRVLFWDTLKLFPMSLRDLPNLYHTHTKKLEENEEFYNFVRTREHKITKQEKEYFYNDLKVLQEVLAKHIEYTGLTFKKTQASQSFYNFEQTFKAWRLRFPPLEIELDDFIRKTYLGGISYVNPHHQGKIIENVKTADINSSYPYELSSKKLPYGAMVKESHGEHPDMSKFWVAEAIVKFKLKPNKVPCIAKRQLVLQEIEKQSFKNIKWVEDSNGLTQIRFCSIDFVTYHDSYEFEVFEWLKVFHWKQKHHKEIQSFILKNNEDKVKYRALAKIEKDKNLKNEYLIKSQRGKINNNSFYGKFGEEIKKIGKNVEVNEQGGIKYIANRHETLSTHKRKFLPIAIATTAYGRKHLITVANILGDDFIYCDTDSVYYRAQGHSKIEQAYKNGIINLDPLELGAWEVEGEVYKRMKAIRPKTYIVEKQNGTQLVTCAGLPADKGESTGSKKRSCVNFDNLEVGTVIRGGNGKLRPVLTSTGKKLVPCDFEIGSNKLDNF